MAENLAALGISVVIPVGPSPEHALWLDEACDSVIEQMTGSDELIIVDNSGHGVTPSGIWRRGGRYWRCPWPVGVAVSWNLGVGLAHNELVLFLGSDDRLLPGCLDTVREKFAADPDTLGWYYLGVEYSDGRTQNTPCHASVVTKSLWELTGGFPAESSIGQPDTIMLSILNRNKGGWWKGAFHKVSERPLYWWRVHEGQESQAHWPEWNPIIAQVRDLMTEHYQPEDRR